MNINRKRNHWEASRPSNTLICVKQKMRLEIWKITKKIQIRKFTKSNPTNLRRHPKTNEILFWILNWKSEGNMTLDYFFIHFLMNFSWKLWNLHFIENPNTIRKARYFFFFFNNLEDYFLHSQNDDPDIYGSPKNFLFKAGNAYIF